MCVGLSAFPTSHLYSKYDLILYFLVLSLLLSERVNCGLRLTYFFDRYIAVFCLTDLIFHSEEELC